MKTPFDFDNGADRQQQYNLVVHIIDDNVKNGKVQQPRTGTTMIMINVVRTNTPPPPTTDFYVSVLGDPLLLSCSKAGHIH